MKELDKCVVECPSCELYNACPGPSSHKCPNKKYFNMGQRRQRDIIVGEYIELSVSSDADGAFSSDVYYNKQEVFALIIAMHREGKTIAEILYHVGGCSCLYLDKPRVCRIIKRWEDLGRPHDMTQYWGKLKN